MADENMSENSNSANSGNSKGAMSPMVIGVIVLAVILVVAAMFFFMGRGANTTEPAMVEEVNSTDNMSESTGESAMDGDVVEVTMEAGSFYFEPNVINAKLGQTVRVTLNSVSMQHDFVIDDLGVKSSVLPSGRSETVEFVASEVGSFEFYCSVGNHRQQGMVGTLNVTE